MSTNQKTKDIVQTYLELPPIERLPVLDRLINPQIFDKPAPPEATLLSRHIRLSLLVGDLYDQLGQYSAPENQDSAEFFHDGFERTKGKLNRARALMRENASRAEHLLAEHQDGKPAPFLERLRRHAQHRPQRAPLYIPELEVD